MNVGLKFKCSGCNETIYLRYLTVGEVAKCKNCGGHNVVPPNAASFSDEKTGRTPQRNQVEPFEAHVDSQPLVIQAKGEETTINTQNDEVEMVSKTDDSISDDPSPRIWELILKFWKHTGAMVVIGIYILLTLPLEILVVQVPGAMGRFAAMLVFWIPINLIAYLFCFRRNPSVERDTRYRRIVFWGMFILIVASFLGNISRNIN